MSPLSDGREGARSQQEIPFGYDLHIRLHQVVRNVPSRQILKDVGSVLFSLLLHGNRAQKIGNSQRDPRAQARPSATHHQDLAHSVTSTCPSLMPSQNYPQESILNI